MSAGRVNLNFQLAPALRMHIPKYTFGSRRPTDITHTNEQDAHTKLGRNKVDELTRGEMKWRGHFRPFPECVTQVFATNRSTFALATSAQDDSERRLGISRFAMDRHEHSFKVGDRVCAKNRTQFPDGIIVRLLDKGFLLVRWNGNLLETVYHTEIELIVKR
ncbi:MAG TPA: hypothetical protein VET48_09040 [Steroidobacteraceae bacterium]|nr:hypothetical protein [Steroidobacteraceae bacterium]